VEQGRVDVPDADPLIVQTKRLAFAYGLVPQESCQRHGSWDEANGLVSVRGFRVHDLIASREARATKAIKQR
jgi:hypothetical protein